MKSREQSWKLLPSVVFALSICISLITPDAQLLEIPFEAELIHPTSSLNAHLVSFFPSASRSEVNDGILRITNVDSDDSTISIEAVDDEGTQFGPVDLELAAGNTIVLNASDIENGNEDKALADGLGSGTGDWRLSISSTSKIDVLAYLLADESLYTTLHDDIEPIDDTYWIPLLPGSGELSTNSYLRISNVSEETAEVTIQGRDDDGVLSGQVRLTLYDGTSRWLSTSDLESGEDLSGELGDLARNWRLSVRASAPIRAMVFTENETGELNNLSGIQREFAISSDANQIEVVSSQATWLPGADSDRGEFFLRVMNQSDRSGQISIAAQDESETDFDDLVLTLDSFEAVHLSADDLEQGNESKSLSGSLGDGQGNWSLTILSDLHFEIGSYMNTEDDALASLQAVAPSRGASNVRAVQLLNTSDSTTTNQIRVDNRNEAATSIRIVGTDESGVRSEPVSFTVDANSSVTVSSDELIDGAENLTGSLGNGAGRWMLAIWSDNPIRVVNLLDSTVRLANVSATMTSVRRATSGSASGDFNGDGKTDLVLRHIDGRWYYYPMDRSSPIADEQGLIELEQDLNWQLAGIGDFDADGRDDILLRHSDGNWMGYLMNGSETTSSSSMELPAEQEWSPVGIGEFTGDGKSDVLLRNTDGNWRMVALDGLEVDSTTGGDISLTVDLERELAGLGDLNGDGRTDIVLRNRSSGEWSLALMNESLTPNLETLDSLSNQLVWNPITIVDLSGDGKDDILMRHSDGRWLLYSMDGNAVISDREISNLSPSWHWQLVGHGDLSGDGTNELLLRHSDGNWMSYRMEGDDAIAGVRSSLALTRNLGWSTYHPIPWQAAEAAPAETAKSVFEASVSQPIVQSKCINCHIAFGLSDHTRLVFVRSSNSQHLELNRKQFEDLLKDASNGKDLVLDKVQGNRSHGGGTQISAGTEDYKNLEQFLELVEQEMSTESSTGYALSR